MTENKGSRQKSNRLEPTSQQAKPWQWWIEKVVVPIVLALISGYFLLIASDIIKNPFQADEETAPISSALKFSDCVVELECPDIERIWDQFPEDTEWDAVRVFESSIPAGKALRFSVGWCTKEQHVLLENLDEIEYVFTIDGVSYADRLKFQYQSNPDSNDETQTDYCQVGGTVVSNWQPGKKYNIEFGVLIKETLNDGWREYVTGEKRYSHILLVIE